jgi:hypothetical protein
MKMTGKTVKTERKVWPKPVQPSEISDPKIIRDAIAQVHRKITPADWVMVREREEMLEKLLENGRKMRAELPTI